MQANVVLNISQLRLSQQGTSSACVYGMSRMQVCAGQKIAFLSADAYFLKPFLRYMLGHLSGHSFDVTGKVLFENRPLYDSSLASHQSYVRQKLALFLPPNKCKKKVRWHFLKQQKRLNPNFFKTVCLFEFEELLKNVGVLLPHAVMNQPFKQLGALDQLRVSLALCLWSRPYVLVFDGLDHLGTLCQTHLLELLDYCAKRDVACILNTSNAALAQRFASHVAFFKGGICQRVLPCLDFFSNHLPANILPIEACVHHFSENSKPHSSAILSFEKVSVYNSGHLFDAVVHQGHFVFVHADFNGNCDALFESLVGVKKSHHGACVLQTNTEAMHFDFSVAQKKLFYKHVQGVGMSDMFVFRPNTRVQDYFTFYGQLGLESLEQVCGHFLALCDMDSQVQFMRFAQLTDEQRWLVLLAKALHVLPDFLVIQDPYLLAYRKRIVFLQYLLDLCARLENSVGVLFLSADQSFFDVRSDLNLKNNASFLTFEASELKNVLFPNNRYLRTKSNWLFDGPGNL